MFNSLTSKSEYAVIGKTCVIDDSKNNINTGYPTNFTPFFVESLSDVLMRIG